MFLTARCSQLLDRITFRVCDFTIRLFGLFCHILSRKFLKAVILALLAMYYRQSLVIDA